MALWFRETEEGIPSEDAELGAQLTGDAFTSVVNIERMLVAYFEGAAKTAEKLKKRGRWFS